MIENKSELGAILPCGCMATETGGQCCADFYDSEFEDHWCKAILPDSGGKYCGHKKECHEK